jgi:hypothetical protein
MDIWPFVWMPVTLLKSPRYFGNDTLVGKKKPASFDAGFFIWRPHGVTFYPHKQQTPYPCFNNPLG